MDRVEYLIPTTRSKILSSSKVVLFLCWLFSHPIWLFPMSDNLANLLERECVAFPCNVLLQIQFFAIYIIAVPFVFSLLLANKAQKIFESKSYPPLSQNIFFKTKITFGAKALIQGFTCAIISLLLAILPGIFGFYLEIGYIICVTEPCKCT